MTDRERLERELFEARQELARQRILGSRGPPDMLDRLGYVPDRDEAFLRLSAMTAEELQAHIQRLKRDLSDLEDRFQQE
jgi:ribosomal protein L29